MFLDRKINTIASVVTAVMTFIGVTASLVYYLSLNPERNSLDKFIMVLIFSSMVLGTIMYTKRRLDNEA